MKSKRLIQILVVFMLTFSSVGGSQPAFASTNSLVQLDAMVINRNLNFWDATFMGFVNSSIHENWHFDFSGTHNFIVTVSPISGDLVPLLILMDLNGNELARGTGTLTSTQPAGNYSIQVQPESGNGFYILTLREIIASQPSVTTVVAPPNLNAGETAVATVSLDNVPAEGYTSAEFICTYDANLLEAGSIVISSLFGADAVAAINGPQNGSFIVAIAGSNGNKATTSGAAFTFNAKGLQAGQSPIECEVRVSKGDNVLTQLPSTGTSLVVTGSTSTATPLESPTPTATSTPIESPTPTASSTPIESPTPVETFTPTATSTPIESPTPTFTSTPIESPTATTIPPASGTLTGQVFASKPVTLSLYNVDGSLATSVIANSDGTFSISAPAGIYSLVATSSGFLSTQGPVTLTAGSSSTQPTTALFAGDIDNNNVIDQFDAMTIGMSYNTAVPAAADLNNDGTINVLDLEILAKNYRKTGPVAWGISYP